MDEAALGLTCTSSLRLSTAELVTGSSEAFRGWLSTFRQPQMVLSFMRNTAAFHSCFSAICSLTCSSDLHKCSALHSLALMRRLMEDTWVAETDADWLPLRGDEVFWVAVPAKVGNLLQLSKAADKVVGCPERCCDGPLHCGASLHEGRIAPGADSVNLKRGQGPTAGAAALTCGGLPDDEFGREAGGLALVKVRKVASGYGPRRGVHQGNHSIQGFVHHSCNFVLTWSQADLSLLRQLHKGLEAALHISQKLFPDQPNGTGDHDFKLRLFPNSQRCLPAAAAFI